MNVESKDGEKENGDFGINLRKKAHCIYFLGTMITLLKFTCNKPCCHLDKVVSDNNQSWLKPKVITDNATNIFVIMVLK